MIRAATGATEPHTTDGSPMPPADRKKPSLPRKHWTRNPVQKPHSTPKGKKGYARRKDKKKLRDEPVDDT